MKKLSNCKLFSLLTCFSLICLLACGGSREESLILVSDRDAAEPSVAAATDGTIYVAWVEHLPEKRADVFLRRFGADGEPLSGAVRVNPETGTATAWRGDPPTVKVGGDGGVYVVWTRRAPVADGAATDLHLSVSRDGGKSFEAPVKINDDALPSDHGMHSLEIDRHGRVYVAWLDERYLKNEAPEPTNTTADANVAPHQHGEPNREVYLAISADGGKTFSANKKIAGNVCPCCKTSIAAAPDGTIYLAWRQVLDGDFRHVAVAASTDGGINFAPFSVVSDDRWQISACPVSGAALSVDAMNKLTVVWFTAGGTGAPGIYRAESSGGRNFSERVLVSGEAAGGTPVIMKDENGDSRIVFSALDKSTRVVAAPSDSAGFTEEKRIDEADLPSAAIAKNTAFVGFVRNADGKRSVYLARQIFGEAGAN